MHLRLATLFLVFKTIGFVVASGGSGSSRCDAGTYSSTGNTPCTKCLPGSYTKEQGQRSCTLARPGYYIPGSGATQETPCPPGAYSSNSGSSSCSSCPPGHMCPNNALANPQQCSPGKFSTGGVQECPKCSAGTFNNIHKATGCCPCPAGWFNSQPGNTNCQKCPDQKPYCGPGNADQNSCSSKPGAWGRATSATQGSDGSCPASPPAASPIARRMVSHPPLCYQAGQKACPLGLGRRSGSHHGSMRWECRNIMSDLESCGGCTSFVNESTDDGRDCSSIPNVDEVYCQGGECIIVACVKGYTPSKDGKWCQSGL